MSGLTPEWGAFSRSGSSSHRSEANQAQEAPKDQKKRPSPVSLRLSFEEKQQLKEMAGRQTVNAYIKARLFDPDAPVRQARGLNPVKDQKTLAQVLGLLGSSRLADNLDDLATAARVGALPLDAETSCSIRRACDDVRIMRRFLLAALGIRDDADDLDVDESCSSVFTRAVHRPDDLARSAEPDGGTYEGSGPRSSKPPNVAGLGRWPGTF